jgi:hypothetical protein
MTTFTDKNKFGGYTHEIEFSPIIVLRLIEMDPETIHVEFVEKRIIRKDKVFFTFISHSSLHKAISEAFGRMKYPSGPLPIQRDLGKINRFEDKVLDFLLEHRKDIIRTSIVEL